MSIDDRLNDAAEEASRNGEHEPDWNFAEFLDDEQRRETETKRRTEDDTETDLSSFAPIDLGPAWRGEKIRPTAEVFPRDDGVALLPPGINYLFGDSGDGKSMVALVATLGELRAGHPVIWVTYEDANEDLIVDRLRQLGATEAEVDLLQFSTPQIGMTYGAGYLADLATTTGARLLVLDSVGEAMAVGGINEDRDNEVGPWFRATLRLIHERVPALAILPIDHSTKAKDNPLFPSGSKRKRAAPTGRMYLLNVGRTGFALDATGYVQLVVAKDRGGTFARGAIAADIMLDATVTPYQWTIKAPRAGDTYSPREKRRNAEERVTEVLAGAAVELTVGELCRMVNAPDRRKPEEAEISSKTVQNALTQLAKRPGVVMSGDTKDANGTFIPAKWRLTVEPQPALIWVLCKSTGAPTADFECAFLASALGKQAQYHEPVTDPTVKPGDERPPKYPDAMGWHRQMHPDDPLYAPGSATDADADRETEP